MRIRILFISLVFFAACTDLNKTEQIAGPELPKAEIEIETGDQVYPDTILSIVNLAFINTLGRDVRILVADCGIPYYVLQRKFADGWRDAYSLFCVGLPFAPLNLRSASQVHSWIALHPEYIDPGFRQGTFRLIFRIVEADSYTLLPDTHRVSNEFQIMH